MSLHAEPLRAAPVAGIDPEGRPGGGLRPLRRRELAVGETGTLLHPALPLVVEDTPCHVVSRRALHAPLYI